MGTDTDAELIHLGFRTFTASGTGSVSLTIPKEALDELDRDRDELKGTTTKVSVSEDGVFQARIP